MTSPRYQPPAVRFPVRRPDAPLALGLLVWLAGAVLLGAWRVSSGPVPVWVPWAGGLGWLGAGWALLHSWRTAARGQLWWDGGAWWWSGAGDEWLALASVQVRMDAQTAMWLAWRSAEGWVQQVWVARSSDPVRWGDWRRAVYSAATVSHMAGNRA